jgi:hypothetical protein
MAVTPGTTILIGDPGEHGSALLDVLRAWSGLGLLEPFLWADPDGSPGGHLVERGELDRVDDVIRLLARNTVPQVRLVCVQILTENDEIAVGPTPSDTSVDRLHAAVTALENRLSGRRSGTQVVTQTNLVVPQDSEIRADPRRLLARWHANVVASPEDRRTDGSFDAGLRSHAEVARHAALHTATLAGLWRGQTRIPTDSLRIALPVAATPVAVARVFAALIVADSASWEVVERALAMRRTRDGTSWVDAVPARDPLAVVATSADDLLERAGKGGFRFSFAGDAPTPVRVRVGVRQALRIFTRYVRTRARALPNEIYEEVREDLLDLAERLAQELIFGEDSVVVVRAGDRPPAGPAKAPKPPTGADIAREVLRVLGSAETPPTQPELWSDLRKVCLGLLDGGDFPWPECAPHNSAHREVLVDPGLVVPAPADIEPPAPPSRPDWWAELAAPTRAVDVLRVRWLRDRVSEHTTDGSAGAAAAYGEIDSWLSRWLPTVLGRVAAGVADQLDDARASLQKRLDYLHAHRDEKRVPRRWRRWLAAVCVLVAWLLTGAGLLVNDHAGLALTALALVAVSVVLGLVAVGLGYRAEFREIYRLRRAELEFAHAATAARAEAREVLRLDTVYTALLDWSEIIAWLVHRPEDAALTDRPATSAADDVPRTYALRVGEGEADPAQVTYLAGRVGTEMITKGWLSSLFRRYDEAAARERRLTRGRPETSIDAVSDAQEADEIRGELLALVRDGAQGRAMLAEFFESVTRQVRAIGATTVYPTVRETLVRLTREATHAVGLSKDPPPPGENTVTTTQSSAAFLADLAPPSDAPVELSPVNWPVDEIHDEAATVNLCQVWLPESVSVDLPPFAERVVTLAHADGARLTLSSFRLDLTHPGEADALSLFRDKPWPVA